MFTVQYIYNLQKTRRKNAKKESKNSPTISASGKVTIGHIGDVYNSDTPQIDLTKNEGVLVPSNLPTPPMPRGCNIPKDLLAVFFGSNVAVSKNFHILFCKWRTIKCWPLTVTRVIVALLSPC